MTPIMLDLLLRSLWETVLMTGASGIISLVAGLPLGLALVLTARGSWMERVDGFDAGADDYLPKPFRSEELLARLRALLRRAGRVQSRVKSADRFTLDELARRVTFDGRELDLSPLEYRMVSLFIDRPGTVLTPAELASQVQGRDDDAAKNAVEAMVARLRKKTDSNAIETRRGFGYVLPGKAR